MISNIDVEEAFYQHYSSLDEKQIIEINNDTPTGDVNNVVAGLKTHCYGILAADDDKGVGYQLFYINGKEKLEGDLIELSLDTKYREHLVYYFCNFLAHNYDDLDPIDTFNTFQSQTRSMLEKIGYITISDAEIDKFENPILFAPTHRGIIKIQFLEKLKIYREIFEKTQHERIVPESEYIYLMLNKRNNYIKIGKSKNPGFREKTLQADEPDIELITFWQAPSQKERELHKYFAKNRVRGEWFDLKFKDIRAIKNFMQEFN